MILETITEYVVSNLLDKHKDKLPERVKHLIAEDTSLQRLVETKILPNTLDALKQDYTLNQDADYTEQVLAPAVAHIVHQFVLVGEYNLESLQQEFNDLIERDSTPDQRLQFRGVIQDFIRHFNRELAQYQNAGDLLIRQDIYRLTREIASILKDGFARIETPLTSSSHGRSTAIRAFISYARRDAENFARKLYSDLRQNTIDAWLDKVHLNSDDTFIAEIDREIKETDYFLLVFTPGAIASDYCRDEWKKALEHCKPIIPLLYIGDYEDLPREAKIYLNNALDFTSDSKYDASFEKVLVHLRKPPRPAGKLYRVPELTLKHVPRELEISTIRTFLTTHNSTVLATVDKRIGIWGMTGVGKTAMATAVARDYVVRRSFSDGILRLTFREDPVLTEIWTQLRKWLGGGSAQFADSMDAADYFEQATADREYLIILDDLWDSKHAEAFKRIGSRCRILITTQFKKVLSELDAKAYKLEPPSDTVARKILTLETGVDNLPQQADVLIRTCGNLPVALRMIGAMIANSGEPNSPVRWQDALDRIEAVEFEDIGALLSDYPGSKNLLAVMRVAIDDLDEDLRARYFDFSIFPDDVGIPESVVIILWNTTRERNVRQILDTFLGRSLLERDGTGRLTIHDLRLALIRRLSGNDNTQKRQQDLLDAYRNIGHGLGWYMVPDDGYIFDHLGYHIARSTHPEQIHELISRDHMEFRRNQDGSYYRFANDLNEAIRLLEKQERAGLPKLLAYSLLYSTMNSISNDMPLEVLKLLAAWGDRRRAAAYAAQKVGRIERAIAYTHIASEERLWKCDIQFSHEIYIVHDLPLLDLALQEIKDVTDYSDEKLFAVLHLAVAFAYAGEHNKAFECADTANEIINRSDDHHHRSRYNKMLGEIAIGLALANKVNEAITALLKIPEEVYDSEIYYELSALAMITYEKIEIALKIILMMRELSEYRLRQFAKKLCIKEEWFVAKLAELDMEKDLVLREQLIVRTIKEMDEDRSAYSEWDEKPSIVRKNARESTKEDSVDKAEMTIAIAVNEIQKRIWTGEYEDALQALIEYDFEIFGKVQFSKKLSQYIHESCLIDLLAVNEQWEEVANICNKLYYGGDRELSKFTKYRVFWRYLKGKLATSHLKFLNELEESSDQDQFLETIVVFGPRLVELGQFDAIFRIFKEHEYNDDYEDAGKRLSILLARFNYLKESISIAETIRDDGKQRDVFEEISGVLIGAGRSTEIVDIAAKLFPKRSERLKNVAKLCSKVHSYYPYLALSLLDDALLSSERGHRKYDSIPDVYAELADQLAQCGDFERALSLGKKSLNLGGNMRLLLAKVFAQYISSLADLNEKQQKLKEVQDILTRAANTHANSSFTYSWWLYELSKQLFDLKDIDALISLFQDTSTYTFASDNYWFARFLRQIHLTSKLIYTTDPQRAANLTRQVFEAMIKHLKMTKDSEQFDWSEDEQPDDYSKHFEAIISNISPDIFTTGWTKGLLSIFDLDGRSLFFGDLDDENEIANALLQIGMSALQENDFDSYDSVATRVNALFQNEDTKYMCSQLFKLIKAVKQKDIIAAATISDIEVWDALDSDVLEIFIPEWLSETHEDIHSFEKLVKFLDLVPVDWHNKSTLERLIISDFLNKGAWEKAKAILHSLEAKADVSYLNALIKQLQSPDVLTLHLATRELVPFIAWLSEFYRDEGYDEQHNQLRSAVPIWLEARLGEIIFRKLDPILSEIRDMGWEGAEVLSYSAILLATSGNLTACINALNEIFERDSHSPVGYRTIHQLTKRIAVLDDMLAYPLSHLLLQFARSRDRDFMCQVIATMLQSIVERETGDSRHGMLVSIYDEILNIEHMWGY